MEKQNKEEAAHEDDLSVWTVVPMDSGEVLCFLEFQIPMKINICADKLLLFFPLNVMFWWLGYFQISCFVTYERHGRWRTVLAFQPVHNDITLWYVEGSNQHVCWERGQAPESRNLFDSWF